MKLIDFVKRTLQESKVDLNKLGLTDLTIDTDLPEDAVKAYEQNLLTRERVEQDPDINKVMQARAFKALNDGWDRDFNAYAESNLPKELAEKVKTETSTRKKWDILREATHAGADDKMRAARQEIEKLNNQLREREAQFNEVKNGYEGKITDFKKEFYLNQKVGGLQFADPYIKLKDSLIDTFKKTISQKGIILEFENEALVPKRKSADGAILDYYEANVKVGLDDLLSKELGDFLKQSTGAGNNGEPPVRKETPIPGQQKAGLSLAEIQRLEVQKKFDQLKQNK
jgi:hypothetical protein